MERNFFLHCPLHTLLRVRSFWLCRFGKGQEKLKDDPLESPNTAPTEATTLFRTHSPAVPSTFILRDKSAPERTEKRGNSTSISSTLKIKRRSYLVPLCSYESNRIGNPVAGEMQRPPHLDLYSRNSLSPPPLQTPPDSSTNPPSERSNSMSPVTTRYTTTSSYRRPSRTSYGGTTSAEEAKSFTLEKDASEEKYMHYFEQLDHHLDIGPPQSSEHQVKQDPSGTLKSTIPRFMSQLM